MAPNDYPIDVRFDYPQQSSRLWAVFSNILILAVVKVLALLPHLIVVGVLSIVQVIVAFVAQIVVAATGEYPPGLFDFVVGVLRWRTRVVTFFLSLNDRYPPFSLQPDPAYPADVVIERPAHHNRLYALFTVIVEILVVIGAVALFARAAHNGFASRYNGPSSSTSGLVLRQIAALPHEIVLIVLSIAVLVLWIVVQFVILFTARFPRSWFDFTAGVVRWQTRVSGYALGLIDRYPPFSFDPSIAAAPGGLGQQPWPGAPQQPWSGAPQQPWSGQQPWPGAQQQPWGGAPTGAQPGPATPGTPPWAGPVTPTPPAGWYPDPAQHHEHRYWDGAGWTPQVADQGQAGVDPLPGPQ